MGYLSSMYIITGALTHRDYFHNEVYGLLTRKNFMPPAALQQRQMCRGIMVGPKLPVEQYLNPAFLAGLNEPVALASARTYEGGKFVASNLDKIADEESRRMSIESTLSLQPVLNQSGQTGRQS